MTETLDKLSEASAGVPARVVLDGGATYLVAMDRCMFVAIDAPFSWIDLPPAELESAVAPSRAKHTDAQAATVRQLMAGSTPAFAIKTTVAKLAAWSGPPAWSYPCSYCQGTGKDFGDCKRCAGEGELECSCPDCGDEHQRECPACQGGCVSVDRNGGPCAQCNGSGTGAKIPSSGTQDGLIAGACVDKRRLARMLAVIPDQAIEVWSNKFQLHLRWYGATRGHAVLMSAQEHNHESLLEGAFVP